MSAIASFYLLDIDKLPVLVEHAEVTLKKSFFSKKIIDNYSDYLRDNVTELKSFDGSGYIYGNLLTFLDEEKGIDLTDGDYSAIANELTEKRGSSHFLLTFFHKEKSLADLDPSKYSVKELQKFNQEFSEDGDIEYAQYSLEALRVLSENLAKVESKDQVLLLIIG